MKGIKLSTFAARCVLLTTFCVLLTACSQTDETEVLSVSIGFVPTVETQTRGTEFTKDNLTSLGVLAYLTQGSSFNALSSTPNFMYNQEVMKATGASTWEYTPTKFWPTNSNDKITFFAYAPHNAKGLILPAAIDRGYPSFTYQVQVAEAAQIDLLVCTPLMNQTYATNNGKVKFVMNHALTKIAIYVKNNDNVSEKTITAFSIRGVKSGTLTFQSLDTDSKGFEWNYPSSVPMETFTTTITNFSVPINSATEKKLLSTFFLLPNGSGNTFSITYKYTGANATETIILNNQPLPSSDKWKPGTLVSYIISIDTKSGVSVTVNSNPAWGNGGAETVDGSDMETR